MPRTKFNVFFFLHARANYSKFNSPMLPEFELIRDFMHDQIICKSHKDPIKTKQSMLVDYLQIS